MKEFCDGKDYDRFYSLRLSASNNANSFFLMTNYLKVTVCIDRSFSDVDSIQRILKFCFIGCANEAIEEAGGMKKHKDAGVHEYHRNMLCECRLAKEYKSAQNNLRSSSIESL